MSQITQRRIGRTDEIIKLNFAGCENNQTKLKITIYEYSGTSLRVRNTFTVSVTGVIPDGFYTNPIERFFWYGNFKGDGTVQLVSMNASRTYRGNYTPSRAAVIDLNTGQRLSENNLFDINTRSNTNSVFSYDIDGDGMTELCHANYTGMDVYKLSGNTFIKDRTIPGFDVYDLPGYSDTLSQIHLTDLNGDGYQEIVRRTGRAAAVFTFTGDEFTSLNFWSFSVDFMKLLERYFDDFMKENSQSSKAEFYLPSAVGRAVKENAAIAKILPTDEIWQGVTYREDVAAVEEFFKSRTLI